MTVGVSHAKAVGARIVACASTGNTSASLAAYAAAAGIPALVLVPETKVAAGKLAQTIAYGAKVVQVDGDFDVALALLRELTAAYDVYLVNSVNPFRLEGQKTIVFEMLEQRGWQAARLDRAAGWQSRQHLRVRQGAGRVARRRTDRPPAAPGRHPGGRRGAVRGLSRIRFRRVRAGPAPRPSPPRSRSAIRHRQPAPGARSS